MAVDLTMGPFDGYVSDRNDPKDDGRIRAVLPGVVDDKTGWLWPDGVATGENQGEFNPPKVGALVNVIFIEGNPNNGRYKPGHWPQGKKPMGATVTADDGDNKVFDDGVIKVERDERGASKGFRVTHVNGDTILEYDASTGRIRLYSPTSVDIKSLGEINLEAAAVTINSRPVLKSGEPI